jgi:hypothetical protein
MFGWIVGGAAALLGAWYVGAELAKTPRAPAKAPGHPAPLHGPGESEGESIDIHVVRADEGEPGWDVMETVYETYRGHRHNGEVRRIVNYPTAEKANAAASKMAQAARKDSAVVAVKLTLARQGKKRKS